MSHATCERLDLLYTSLSVWAWADYATMPTPLSDPFPYSPSRQYSGSPSTMNRSDHNWYGRNVEQIVKPRTMIKAAYFITCYVLHVQTIPGEAERKEELGLL